MTKGETSDRVISLIPENLDAFEIDEYFTKFDLLRSNDMDEGV
jgi:hypothetical protein